MTPAFSAAARGQPQDMTATDTMERALLADLRELRERYADDEFMGDLYRALANRTWHHEDGSGGDHVALSWRRAEEVVNELRATEDAPPLTLAQTGGEGEVSRAVEDELGPRGWRHRPLNTGRHDDQHSGQPTTPPPGDQGARLAPDDSHPTLTKSAKHSGEVSGDRSGNNVA